MGKTTTPFFFWVFRHKDESFKVRSPFLCPITFDDDSYFVVEVPRLNILAYAKNRPDLTSEIAEQLSMLWQEYAMADDDTLDDGAKALKLELLITLERKVHV